jgi:hypothetical protein
VLFSALVYYFTAARIPKTNFGLEWQKKQHQIGTPLSSLIGWVEILNRKMLMNQQRLRLKRY